MKKDSRLFGIVIVIALVLSSMFAAAALAEEAFTTITVRNQIEANWKKIVSYEWDIEKTAEATLWLPLYLVGGVQAHEVQDPGVVYEFRHAPRVDALVQGVDEDELVRMHGDAHGVLGDEGACLRELALEPLLPGIVADRMRGEGDEVRRDAEVVYVVFQVEAELLQQAGEVAPHRTLHVLRRVGLEAKGPGAAAVEGKIDARVTYLHGR